MSEDHLQTGCIIPALQALASGLFSALAVFGLALALDLAPERAGLLALAGGAACSLGVWFWRLGYWQTRLNLDAAIEYNLLAEDTPQQQQAGETVRVELLTQQGANRQTAIIDLPASPGQLQTLAEGLLAGEPLSQARWTGSNAPFSRAEYVTLVSTLARRGLAAQASPDYPNRGFVLTPSGRGVMRRLAEVDNV